MSRPEKVVFKLTPRQCDAMAEMFECANRTGTRPFSIFAQVWLLRDGARYRNAEVRACYFNEEQTNIVNRALSRAKKADKP